MRACVGGFFTREDKAADSAVAVAEDDVGVEPVANHADAALAQVAGVRETDTERA